MAKGRAILVVAAVLLAVGGTIGVVLGMAGEPEGLARALANRGRIATLGDVGRMRAEGTTFRPVEQAAAVRTALGRQDAAALGEALDAAGIGGLLIAGQPIPAGATGTGPLRDRLTRYEHVDGLRGVYLAPSVALYLRSPAVSFRPPFDVALSRVARGILSGQRPPRIESFPETLRERRSVEVMVLLRDRGRPRLWRSARGSSVARGLLLAAGVARERWQEREAAMGGPIEEALPRMDVEVSLLEEDGTLGSSAHTFLDRVITPVHGVAFERKGLWRYKLPAATARDGGGARGFARLFEEQGYPPEASERPDVRLYRLVVSPLAVSPAPLSGSGSLGAEVDALEAEARAGSPR